MPNADQIDAATAWWSKVGALAKELQRGPLTTAQLRRAANVPPQRNSHTARERYALLVAADRLAAERPLCPPRGA